MRPVSLWSVSEEQQKSVKEALVNAFGVADGDRKEFAMVILEASLNIAEDNIGDYLQDILLATQDSPLEEMDKFNIRLKMKQLLANSISYMLFFVVELNQKSIWRQGIFRISGSFIPKSWSISLAWQQVICQKWH